jgi:non-ribosomal peptide synthetase-like protein
MGTPVSIDSHFFDDLGADSLVMAQFCARVRKRVDLPSVSMKDIYQYPTIRGLATAFADPAAGALAPPAPGPVPPGSPAPGAGASVAEPVEVARASTASYIACGVLQLVAFLGYLCLTTTVLVRGFEWISVAPDAVHVYLRSLLFCGLGFIVLCLFPILAKWMLVDRWTPREIPVWSLAYFRFWVVKTLIRTNPLVLFAGSPLYVLYLRALGAKIGRGVAIFSRNVPVCTDLLTIGDGTVIRKDSYFLGYRAHAGVIQTGPVTLGRDVFVGEKTVLEIGAWMGDGAQLGHTSALHAGQGVPAGERWHGSPAQRTTTDYRAVPSGNRGAPRTVCYSVLQLLNPLILVPLGVAIATLAIAEAPRISRLLGPELLGPGLLGFTSWRFYLALLGVSAVLFFGGVLLGFIVLVTVPRLLRLAITPGKVYPLYGIHYWVHRRIAGITNSKFFTELFGDTSYIVHYLRSLGYDLSPVEQTGSNFGMSVQHESPFVSSVGAGTVVADGLSIINADFSNSSFRVSRASIGRHNFLGNHIAYPAQGRTGDNCLLATKVMVPIDGPIREGVGLLGSPCFEVPRTVERDKGLDVRSPDELRRGLAAKNRHNLVSIAWRLLVRWVHFFGLMVLVAVAAGLYDSLGALAFVLDALVVPVFTVAYFVLVERAVDGLHTLVPGGCSIYDRVFWRHERSWKVPSESYFQAFDGTPFKSVLWRLLGVRVGRRIFDDGCFLTERPFVALGDYCTLNPGSVVQCHSQEDGAFKSDVTAIGAGCTLGVGAFVHYGVTIGDGATLAADSFLMKGEEIPPHERWGGNPASELRHDHYRATERSGRTVPSVAA